MCVYVLVFACIFVYGHIFSMFAFAFVHVHVYLCMYECAIVCIHACLCLCMWMFVNMCESTACVHICNHMYACMIG